LQVWVSNQYSRQETAWDCPQDPGDHRRQCLHQTPCRVLLRYQCVKDHSAGGNGEVLDVYDLPKL